jgi:hypothetical protein
MSGASGDFTLGAVSLRGQTRLVRRFENATQALHDRLRDIIRTETDTIADLARARMGELFSNPGRMQASVSTKIDDGGTVIEGSVSATGLPFLAIQEYGGVTSPHDIFPVNAQVLFFMTPRSAQFRAGSASAINEVFAPVVHHPGSVLPERSYLRYALAQRRSAILAAFARAPGEVLGDG